jgi:poly[(R)-3-hydroxyalkanoate] polymerase subunit PhaC
MSTTTPEFDTSPRDLGAPLDALLVDAASGSLYRFLPGAETAALGASLTTKPLSVAGETATFAKELSRVLMGTSSHEPSTRDRRFADTAWHDNPFLHRTVQAYVAAGESLQRLLDIAQLEQRDDLRMRFLADNLYDAAAPSNLPWLNPAAIKEVINTGGANLLRGLRSLVRDMATPPRVPSMVDSAAFSVGENLAVTPGAVVLRTPVFELIQYAPTTSEVNATPLLLVPPTINKYYVLDLAPGRSLVEHLLQSGQQVFVVSWRNPGVREADWGLDTYIEAVIQALDATREICQADQALLFGACSGGIISSMAAAYLAGTGRQDELAGLTLAVTVLDQSNAGLAGALIDRGRADAALARSARAGYLDGRSLAEVFAWLRPTDLVWNYWVNNYLLGKKPPAFDILYWNADTTRMPAHLHRDFLEAALANTLVTAGAATALGVPVDLAQVTVDSYVIGGVADHITPWQSCYRTTQLLGGATRFVLSTNGHIAALVNPTTNTKSSFQTAKDNPADPLAWLGSADTQQGSWWADYVGWLSDRSGALKPAPAQLGRGRFTPIASAPGTYVLDK